MVGSRFEISIPHAALQQGAFDVQQIAAIPAAKFIRTLGALTGQQLETIEKPIAHLLGLTLAKK